MENPSPPLTFSPAMPYEAHAKLSIQDSNPALCTLHNEPPGDSLLM